MAISIRVNFVLIPSLCLIALSPLSAFCEDAFIGRVVSVNGKALIRGPGIAANQIAFVKVGDRLYKESILNTASDGSVKLLMTDRTILDLGPSSLLKMNDFQLKGTGNRTVDLSLDYGNVRASVNEKLTSQEGKFTIRTKAATMGVRGTEFVVQTAGQTAATSNSPAEPPKTVLTVMHGKVEVTDPAKPNSPPVPVTPGFQFAQLGDGKPGAVAELKPEAVAAVKQANFQADKTFIQSVAYVPNNSNSSSNSKSGSSSEGGKSEGAKENSSGGAAKQAIETINATVQTQANEFSDRGAIAETRLPGTTVPPGPQPRPIDQLNGRVVNLRVNVCIPGRGC